MNVLRISASAFIGLLLPPVLIRLISPDVYSVWVLILQLSGYVGLFDFGLQTAVGRFIAHAYELDDHDQQSKVISTALAMLGAAALLSIGLIGALAWQLPHLFPNIQPSLRQDSQLALLYVGCSLAIGLPFSVFNGIFIGQQRNHVPVAITVGSKIISALLVIMAASITVNLVVMSVVIALTNFVTYAIQYGVYRRLAKSIKVARTFISQQMGQALFAYCLGISMWSLAVLLIAGLDTTLVGVFEFKMVPYYAIAASIVTFIAAMQSAAFSALLPAGARLHAHGNEKPLGALLISTTRYSLWIVLIISMPFIFFAKDIFALWLGASYPAAIVPLFRILLMANILRMTWTPYFTLLAATGQQRLVIVTPFVEGVANLLFSLIGGFYFGALGIAGGTVVGAVVGFVCYTFYNMPRTHAIQVNIREYLFEAIVRPMVCTAPAYLLLLVPIVFSGLSVGWTAMLLLLTVGVTLAVSWQYGFTQTERQRAKLMLASVISLSSKQMKHRGTAHLLL